MKRLTICFMIVCLLCAACFTGCHEEEKPDPSTSQVSELPASGHRYQEAENLAKALVGEELFENEDTTVKGTAYTGDVVIDGKTCNSYRVSYSNGSNSFFAVDENGQWYYEQDGTYVPISVGSDGTISVGNNKQQEVSGQETNEEKRTTMETILLTFLQTKSYKIESGNNGQLNGQNCSFYVVKVDGKTAAQIANAATENDAWYYQDEKEGFFRHVKFTGDTPWAAEPVNNTEKAIQWMVNAKLGKTGDVMADSAITMNGVDCTLYRVEQEETILAYVAVSVDNTWYFGDETGLNFSPVTWSENGMDM